MNPATTSHAADDATLLPVCPPCRQAGEVASLEAAIHRYPVLSLLAADGDFEFGEEDRWWPADDPDDCFTCRACDAMFSREACRAATIAAGLAAPEPAA